MVAPDGGGMTEVILDQYLQDKPERGQQTPPEKVVLGHHDYPFLALVPDPAGLALDSDATVTSQTETELTITRQT